VRSYNGMSFLFVISEYISRMGWAIALPDIKAVTVRDAAAGVFDRYGV